MKEYFGEDKVLNVATFSKISSKTAIERACKGLGVKDEVSGYLKSLIPVNRGKVSKLKEAVFGDKEKNIQAVSGLKAKFNKYPNLLESALGLEGLITNRGTHAAGVIVCNESYTEYIAAMRSADGTLETCYDLWDSEKASCIKFDMLTVVCADQIHKTMDLLLADGKIEWQGSLKETYYKYFHPDAIEYKDKEMWKILPTIYSVFQFDTPISQKALSATKPQSAMDLSAANSLLRLMPDGADETPIDRYKRYKESHQAWIDDTVAFGLNDEERECLWEYLSDAYGMADSQEKIMRLSMDKRVSGYSLKEANKLRKSIAKKDEKLQEEARQMFYAYGIKLGTREVFLDYIWNVVFAASMGYSFSQLHSYSYSIIALQELNLNYFYSRVYWNCACLSVEATGITDEGEDRTKTSSTDYGEVAKAIYKMKKYGVNVDSPSINNANLDFTPMEKTNSILFGIGGIASINQDIASQVINNRPYLSFADFYKKNTYEGSLVTQSKIIQFIKAGCFDEFEPDRIKVMKQYIILSTDPKKSLTMSNIAEAIKVGAIIPKNLIAPYNFKKYVCSKQFFYSNHPNFKSKKLYWLDEKAMRFFNKSCRESLQEGLDWFEENGYTLVVDKSLDKLFKPTMDELKKYINTPQFIKKFYQCCCLDKYKSLVQVEDVNKWSFEALSYYSKDHELANVNFAQYNISHFSDLPEEPIFINKSWGNRTWKQYEISCICGTVIDKVDTKHYFTILTPDDEVVNVNMPQGQYANYKSQISVIDENGKNKIVEKSWLARGNLLMVVGYRKGNNFVCKRYSKSIYQHCLMKIEKVNDDGSIDIINERYGSDE